MENKIDLVVTRVFDAPQMQVWNAWTNGDHLKQWWGPHGFTCPVAEMDVREGGTSLVGMHSPEHGEHFSTWSYRRIVPMERIEFIHNLSDEEGNRVEPTDAGMPPDFPADQFQTVEIKAISPSKTELTVTEFGWTEGQMLEFARIGLEQCLEKMAASFAEAA